MMIPLPRVFLPPAWRPRRRGIAAVNAAVRDGIVPAADALAQTDDHHGGVATSANFRTTALIIACALFMEFLDATVLATALPTMARDFGVGAPQMSIALTSYLLALAIFIPASAALADRFGARAVFAGAIVLFVAGSLASGLAPSVAALALSRFAQGIGGAMMIPVGRLVLLRSVAKRDMVAAMSWLLVPALIGPILGPPLGGQSDTNLSCRRNISINLPVGLVGFALVLAKLPDVREAERYPFDARGFALSGVALGCLLAGFEMASRPGAGRAALALVAVGAAAGALYLRHAKRRDHPILDVTLMKVDTFRLSVVAGSLTRITQGAQPFLLPLMMQLGFGFTAAQSGLITVATALGSLGMKSSAKHILRRLGFRRGLLLMGSLGTLGYAACGLFRPGWPVPAIFATLLACGFVMSFQFTAYNTLAYDEVSPKRMSQATAFYSTFQQLMLSLGICVAAVALHASMLWRGHGAPGFADFTTAFWTVTAISAGAILVNRRLSPHAGAEISGHAAACEPRPATASSQA